MPTPAAPIPRRAVRTAAWALAFAASAVAGPSHPLEDLETEVAARLASGEIAPKARRALERIDSDLADDVSLSDRAATARRADRTRRSVFPGDAPLRDGLVRGADALLDAADLERASLGPALVTLPAEPADVLARGLAAAGRRLDAARAAGLGRKLTEVEAACRRLDAARRRSGAAPVAGPAPQPDFALRDVNAASPSHRRKVTARSRLGSVSAWYFGHST